MATIFSGIEDYLIGELDQALRDSSGEPLVRQVAPLPGPWSMETLRQVLDRAPAVYLLWLGGRGQGGNQLAVDARWGVYAIANHASGADRRRRGDAQQIGAYEMLERAAPRLHGLDVPDRGGVVVDRLESLVNDATFQLGASVYQATVTIPNLVLPLGATEADFDDFATFHATYDLDTTQDAEPEAEDDVTMP